MSMESKMEVANLNAVEKALSKPEASTIAKQMDVLVEQLERATAQAQRVLTQIELIRKAIGI